MQIAICDDQSFFRSELRKYLVDYKKERRVQIDVSEFQNGRALIESKEVFDMVFMDYQMPGLDGMATARIFRERNSMCTIVFVTNYPEFVFESFEVNPYRFFRKPISGEEIAGMLDVYIRQQKLLSPIIINGYEGQKTIASKDVVYLEGDGKYCIIRTVNDTVHSSKTLSGVLTLLPQYCFYRVHRSYAVNMYHVERMDNNTILLLNGERVLVGRNHIADFKKAYREFVKNYYLRI